MALKCWRDYGEKERGIGGLGSGVTANVVLCKTAHPAFTKACEYLQIEARFVAMNTDHRLFGTMDLDKMEAAIDHNTICIVASAPCYPYSVVDDVKAICAVASFVVSSFVQSMFSRIWRSLVRFERTHSKTTCPLSMSANVTLSLCVWWCRA